MYEATFRITGHSSYADATASGSATIELWCNRNCDLLRVSEEAALERDSGEAAPDVVQRTRETVGVQEQLSNRNETLLVTGDCLREHETDLIEPYLDRYGCLLLYPLRYEGGDKVCRIISLSATALTECFHDLVDDGIPVTVDAKREIASIQPQSPLLAPHGVAPELTARQSEVVTYAYENGYYAIPREMRTEDIAEEIGVERRTAEEHLRRAENKILAAVVDYLD